MLMLMLVLLLVVASLSLWTKRFWNEVKSRLQASANSFASTVTQSPFRDHGLMFGRCKLQLHAARHHLLGCFLLTVYRSLFFLAAVLEITTAVSHGKLNKNRNLMLTQMGKDCHKLSKTWCIDPLGGSEVFTGRCF